MEGLIAGRPAVYPWHSARSTQKGPEYIGVMARSATSSVFFYVLIAMILSCLFLGGWCRADDLAS